MWSAEDAGEADLVLMELPLGHRDKSWGFYCSATGRDNHQGMCAQDRKLAEKSGIREHCNDYGTQLSGMLGWSQAAGVV